MGKAPIPENYEGLPVAGVEKMRELDARATSEYGIAQETLMENAGAAAAGEILKIAAPALAEAGENIRAVICCGRGNNGGDGLVAARVLRKRGAVCEVFLISPKSGKEFGALTVLNIKRAQENGVAINFIDYDLAVLEKSLASCTIAVDALLGTGSVGKPVGVLKRVIQLMNKSGKPITAIDIPSGIDPETGYHSGVFIKAGWTLTLGLAKRGLLAAHAQPNVGVLKVLDIGYPKELICPD